MKRALILSLCLRALCTGVRAQLPETFDIATFRPPKGWKKQASQDSVKFSTEDTASGAYCLITLLKSLPGPGNSKENFDTAWQTLVRGAVNVTAAPADAAFEQPRGLESRDGIISV